MVGINPFLLVPYSEFFVYINALLGLSRSRHMSYPVPLCKIANTITIRKLTNSPHYQCVNKTILDNFTRDQPITKFYLPQSDYRTELYTTNNQETLLYDVKFVLTSSEWANTIYCLCNYDRLAVYLHASFQSDTVLHSSSSSKVETPGVTNLVSSLFSWSQDQKADEGCDDLLKNFSRLSFTGEFPPPGFSLYVIVLLPSYLNARVTIDFELSRHTDAFDTNRSDKTTQFLCPITKIHKQFLPFALGLTRKEEEEMPVEVNVESKDINILEKAAPNFPSSFRSESSGWSNRYFPDDGTWVDYNNTLGDTDDDDDDDDEPAQ